MTPQVALFVAIVMIALVLRLTIEYLDDR